MLRLFLLGLVALVIDSSTKDVWILLLDSRDPEPICTARPAPHHPVLIFERSSLPEDEKKNKALSGDEGEKIKRRLNLAKQPYGWFLENDVIQITGLKAGALTPVYDKRPKLLKLPTNQEQAKDLSWAVHIAKEGDIAGTISKDYLDVDEIHPDLAGLLQLSKVQGSVKTFSLGRVPPDCPKPQEDPRKGVVPNLKFKDPPRWWGSADLNQAVADIIIVELELKDKKAKVTAGARSTELVLGGSGYIDVALGNLTRLPPSAQCEPLHALHEVDAHFGLYMNLVKKAAECNELPLPAMGPLKVDAALVQPKEIPDFLLELGERGDVGSLSRPICTTTVFVYEPE
ncbi:MAG TPA: hypothetical protein VNJ70_13820 [Thermoanaerobaculia bacterium]|nr:hypothetical protein [Thermoanaerobaculia bacterium]